MYYDFKVPIPNVKGKIYPQERNGVTYVQYEYARVYNPDKKYNTPKRTTIGKVCEDDSSQMYPNPNYLKYFPEAELPVEESRAERSGCLRIGNYLVIQKLLRETLLDRMVANLYGDPRGSAADGDPLQVPAEPGFCERQPDQPGQPDDGELHPLPERAVYR